MVNAWRRQRRPVTPQKDGLRRLSSGTGSSSSQATGVSLTLPTPTTIVVGGNINDTPFLDGKARATSCALPSIVELTLTRSPRPNVLVTPLTQRPNPMQCYPKYYDNMSSIELMTERC